ncbi:MAG TPA: VCBS repeat-containing protein, partial [Pirellulales bacterium]|nr:VCBS repeat-containing protein [Pirellulales bacterium]
MSFSYQNGRSAGFYTILESLGGGVALFDFDNDGRHDVFFTGGGRFIEEKQPSGLPSSLWHNLGDWHFSDVTAPADVGRSPHYSHGCAAGDFDNDGFSDLLVTGYGGLLLFHNQGDGTFLECSRSAALDDTSWSTSAAWGDLDGDNQLDLYVAHYVDWSPSHDPRCPGEGSLSPLRAKLASARPDIREICSPRSFAPLPDVVYYSNGDGTFRDATSEARLRTDADMCGRGLGVVMGDIDLDGDLDIYVANDTDDNFLYLNDGQGRFNEVAALEGVARGATGAAQGSMGVDLGDHNLDGLPDLWVVNFEK